MHVYAIRNIVLFEFTYEYLFICASEHIISIFSIFSYIAHETLKTVIHCI